MIIDSEECTDKLNKYKAKGKIDMMAIKILLAKDSTYIPEFQAMTSTQLRDVKRSIRIISNTIGIEEIA